MTRVSPATKLGLALLLVSCGGKMIVDHEGPGDGERGARLADGGSVGSGIKATGSGGVGSTSGSVGSGEGGLSQTGQGGAGADGTAGAGNEGGNGGVAGSGAGSSAAGAPATGGDGGEGGGNGAVACTTKGDCPAAANACVLVTCNDGLCGTKNRSAGTFVAKDEPADCKDTVCDGSGNLTTAVDQNNVLTPENPCLQGTCNSIGTTGTKPVPARTACLSDSGGVMCNGSGVCVQCLLSADCAEDEVCNASKICEVATCSDVDCGGVCPACNSGKQCLIDSDCLSYACDSAAHTCIANHCFDHHRSGTETDVDCGGGICAGCDFGGACLIDADCGSQACDGLSLSCVTDQCTDHRLDGQETDVDCGGSVCSQRCALGKKCITTADCGEGSCFPGNPHICM